MQRLTYSDQKKRHFVRPFTVCCSDGLIVDIYGPFAAVNNDASILKQLLEEENEQNNVSLRSILRPGDFLILDRGFRDCGKQLKKELKLNIRMPASN